MSLIVLSVAAAHAAPPLIGGFLWRTDKAVIIGAVIGFGVAIASGSPAFIVPDLIGVGVVTWFGFSIVNSLKN